METESNYTAQTDFKNHIPTDSTLQVWDNICLPPYPTWLLYRIKYHSKIRTSKQNPNTEVYGMHS